MIPRTLSRKLGLLCGIFTVLCLNWFYQKYYVDKSDINKFDEALISRDFEIEEALQDLKAESEKDVQRHEKNKLNQLLLILKSKNIIHQNGYSTKCDIIRRSPLYSLECSNEGTDVRQLLITGTGRSGTEYIQMFLNQTGLKLSHDTIGPSEDGGVSWPQAFNEIKCGKIKWNWLKDTNGVSNNEKNYRFHRVIQIIRNPLKQILSRANRGGFISSENRFYTSCLTHLGGGIKRISEAKMSNIRLSIILALRHWVLFNSFIERYAAYTFRVEDLDHNSTNQFRVIRDIYKYGGLAKRMPAALKIEQASTMISQTLHHKHTKKPKGLKISWKYLFQLDPKFTTMAQILTLRYGYEINPEDLAHDVIVDCGDILYLRKLHCEFSVEERWRCKLLEPVC